MRADLMPAKCRFDEAIPALARYIVRQTDITLSQGVFVRDGFGRICFYTTRSVAKKALKSAQFDLSGILGGVAFPAGAIQARGAPGSGVLDDPDFLLSNVEVDGETYTIKVIERHFFGRDWVMKPTKSAQDAPKTMVFCSLKGGVGRSTALFVLANHLAQRGSNVLCVDLDLEAPGLAPLLFEGGERPLFGVVDYLVESSTSGVTDADLGSFVGTSLLTDRLGGQGRVDLAPATGRATQDHPENMISKLARALLEEPQADGPPLTLSAQIKRFIDRICARSNYDAVLVDARAGFSELTAGPLLGLGGNVLLFATEHPHTFEGYRYLMAHLSRLPVDPHDDWRERITFVHSMASPAAVERQSFDDRLYETLADSFYEQDYGEEAFTFSFDDEIAPHKAWRIFYDGRFAGIDPVNDRALLDTDVYQASFGKFIDKAINVMGIANLQEDLN